MRKTRHIPIGAWSAVAVYALAACSGPASSDAPSTADAQAYDASVGVEASAPNDAGGALDTGSTADVLADSAPTTSGNFPTRFVAPYVATWLDTDLVKLSNDTGNKFWTLAFVIPAEGGACTATWNGNDAITSNHYAGYVDALHAIGGDAIVSFGGADGGELAQACTSVAATQAAYQQVIDALHVSRLDFDIEEGVEKDAPATDRRNKALRNLQLANPGLQISYTLGVDRTGLPAAQRDVLSNALTNGVIVDVVNVMAMDYGPCYPDMGQAAIDAAVATRDQLVTLGMTASVGVTPMLGENDVACEIFETAAATALVDYAQTSSFIKVLSYWKENGSAADKPFDYPTNEFIDIFKTFH